MDLNLSGKRAVVAGGSRGIGYAIAESLAREGATVVIAARDQSQLDRAAQSLSQLPGRVIAIRADTTDDASVGRLVARCVEELGGVDILINAAASPGTLGKVTRLSELQDSDLRAEIETKVLGYLRMARAVAPHMIAQGWGRIINVSGLAARQSGSTFGSIRNVAVAAMTKNLADELGRFGINVTVVHPGPTLTERTPASMAASATALGISIEDAQAQVVAGISIGRMVTAAEIADVVVFLASPRSISITGDAIATGGGVRGPIFY